MSNVIGGVLNITSRPEHTLNSNIIEELRRLYRQCFSHDISSIGFLPPSYLYLISSDTSYSDIYAVASITGNLTDIPAPYLSSSSPNYYLFNVCTREDQRGRGYMKRLLRAILDSLHAGTKIFLKVYTDNTPAIHLYKSLGFEELDRYYDWPTDRDIMLMVYIA